MEEFTIEELKNNNSKRVSILTYRGEGDPVIFVLPIKNINYDKNR